MRTNLPVIDEEYEFPAGAMLVSMTDTKGHITHANASFFEVSGFSPDELIGENHNIVRHPSMPAEAFRDLWRTIGRGHPWTGLVKNRRKDGRYYWVRANVTPVMENGKPVGYLSVRTKPERSEVQAASALYEQLNQETKAGRPSFHLKEGQIHWHGIRGLTTGLLTRWFNVSLSLRLAASLMMVVVLGMWPLLLGDLGLGVMGSAGVAWLQFAGLVLGTFGMLSWFRHFLVKPLDQLEQFARDLAACNLKSTLDIQRHSDVARTLDNLRQLQINLRAVIGDARIEAQNFNAAASDIAAGSQNLAARAESQASSLEETAASMEEISGTVKNTAAIAGEVLQRSERSTAVASEGGASVQELSEIMSRIQQSSAKMGDIVNTIESIAFQTNLLALNAAVEAARAGEAGKGFAVVAGEVRALAGRSANAAKEIRDLIADSSSKIGQGADRMTHARKTINEVVSAVEEVGRLIDQISNAAREQTLGVAQVNEAIAHLDQITQQNAALAEESAAASTTLYTGAAALTQSMKVFRM